MIIIFCGWGSRFRSGAGGVEFAQGGKREMMGNVYDVSVVMENVRWDLNKEFTRFTTDMLNSYYTNRVEWPAMLAVTGGGGVGVRSEEHTSELQSEANPECR